MRCSADASAAEMTNDEWPARELLSAIRHSSFVISSSRHGLFAREEEFEEPRHGFGRAAQEQMIFTGGALDGLEEGDILLDERLDERPVLRRQQRHELEHRGRFVL